MVGSLITGPTASVDHQKKVWLWLFSHLRFSLSLLLTSQKKKNLHRLQAKKKKKKEGKWRTKMLLLAYSHILSPSQSYLPHPHAYLHLCSDSPLFLVDEANPQLFHGFCESLFSSSSKIFQILLFVTQIQVFLLSLFLFSILIFFFLITGIVNLMVILILHWICVKLQMEDQIDRLSHWIRLISWNFQIFLAP